MTTHKMAVNLALFGLVLGLVVGVQVFHGWNITSEAVAATERCPEGGTTLNGAGPFTIPGNVAVCVKAGTQIFSFPCGGGSDGCYTVTFDGVNTIVSGGGTGPACKAISHIAFYTDCGPPPPSPSPSPSPTP